MIHYLWFRTKIDFMKIILQILYCIIGATVYYKYKQLLFIYISYHNHNWSIYTISISRNWKTNQPGRKPKSGLGGNTVRLWFRGFGPVLEPVTKVVAFSNDRVIYSCAVFWFFRLLLFYILVKTYDCWKRNSTLNRKNNLLKYHLYTE